MTSDPISDLLTRIKNGYLARRRQVVAPHSQAKEKIAKILVQENYLKSLKVKNLKSFKQIICELKYDQAAKPVFTDVKRVSKPGCRVYAGWKKIPWTLSGYGVTLISTPKGLMTGKEARKKRLGGEILAQVW